jgi:hypothetical protein
MTDPDPLNAERQRRRRARNWALFAVLGGFAVLIYAVTIVKIRLGYGP